MAVSARTWTSGETVTAAMMNTLRDDINTLDTAPGFIAMDRLTSDQTWTTDTTLADITGLAFTIGASEVWSFIINTFMGSPAAADAKYHVTVPSGATGRYGLTGQFVSTTAGSNTIGNDVDITTPGTVPTLVIVAGTVVNSTTAGTVQLQAAQVVASGTMTVYANSSIVAVRLL